jgi:hypothetical protein
MGRPAVSFATRKPVVATSLSCNALHPVAPLYGPCSKAHAPKCS